MDKEVKQLQRRFKRSRVAIYAIIGLLIILTLGLYFTTQRINDGQALQTQSQAYERTTQEDQSIENYPPVRNPRQGTNDYVVNDNPVMIEVTPTQDYDYQECKEFSCNEGENGSVFLGKTGGSNNKCSDSVIGISCYAYSGVEESDFPPEFNCKLTDYTDQNGHLKKSLNCAIPPNQCFDGSCLTTQERSVLKRICNLCAPCPEGWVLVGDICVLYPHGDPLTPPPPQFITSTPTP